MEICFKKKAALKKAAFFEKRQKKDVVNQV